MRKLDYEFRYQALTRVPIPWMDDPDLKVRAQTASLTRLNKNLMQMQICWGVS